MAWARSARVLQHLHQVRKSCPSTQARKHHHSGPLQVPNGEIRTEQFISSFHWFYLVLSVGRQIWCTWSRAADSITSPLPSPQCWRGQDGCVHRSGPPHSARPWSWFCGYLRSGGRTAQRADVHGAESGEFASNLMIYKPERLNKRRKKWFCTVFYHKSRSAVVLLLTLYSALLWSLPHKGIPILTTGDRQWNKSTLWAGFPYLEMTTILHSLSVSAKTLCLEHKAQPPPQLFLVADTYEPAAYTSSSLRLQCSACQTGCCERDSDTSMLRPSTAAMLCWRIFMEKDQTEWLKQLVW